MDPLQDQGVNTLYVWVCKVVDGMGRNIGCGKENTLTREVKDGEKVFCVGCMRTWIWKVPQ